MKIVINTCYGGFCLSDTARQRYVELTGQKPDESADNRADPILIQVIEELGPAAANDKYAEFKVIEIPDDVKWEIQEYDGAEWIAEQHRTWS